MSKHYPVTVEDGSSSLLNSAKKYNSQNYPHIWENLSKREDRGSIPPVRLDC